MNRPRLRRRLAVTTVALAAVVATAAACSSGNGGSNGKNGGGGHDTAPGAATNTVTVAGVPNEQPNWILPFPDPTHLSPTNLPWQEMMYPPLYWFGQGSNAVLNTDKSLAEPPQYSADRKTVTIKMKPWKWSNGDPITAQNVMFWLNMAKTNKDKLGIYSPGYIPDNIVSGQVTAPDTLVLHLDKAYNEDWFTFSQLSQMWVFPEAWDLTGPGKKANCSTNASECPAVYNYLYAQSKDLPNYATNPLWQVVDGPWKMQKFSADGNITMVPNTNYSGPNKPKISKYVQIPFTDTSAEYNVLQQGNKLDVGYIPSSALNQPRPDNAGPFDAGPSPVSNKYDMVVSQAGYGPGFLQLNYNDPKMGPVFKQLYFRQALASTVDQQSIIKNLYKNYGLPTYGPVPAYPASKWVPSVEQPANYPYPFNLAKAKTYLSDNGWQVNPGGTSVCQKPGTGQGECGAGITQGEKLAFEFIYFSGDVTTKTLVSAIKSNASQVGIDITLHPMPGNLIQSIVHQCAPAQCQWQSSQGAWYYVYYPSGEQVFKTGAFANFGSFSDPQIDQLIDESHTAAGNQGMLDYATATTKALPGIWMPSPENLGAFAKGLKGYPTGAQDPYGFPYASDLYFEK